MEKAVVEAAVSGLLREWCGALLDLQLDAPGEPTRDGGIFCPACGRVHGRCHEAVYPLLYLADATDDEKYLTAAKKLFAWGENMLRPDGSVSNDTDSPWQGVTVFASVTLHDALKYHGALLDETERRQWEKRLLGMGEWLSENITVGSPAYLNYYAANACAMTLLGGYFERPEFLRAGRELAAYCFGHVSENGLVFGEGKPHDLKTPKGCRAVDLGYNVEETLPSLCRYAEAAGDAEAEKKCRALYRAHLAWMLPDGAWDNSMGTRAFKWTYWGSRTADGAQDALFRLGRTEPVFAEAAMRNLELYHKCTGIGLLYGGPDYARAGEPPCVHHTFCHAKALAAVLDAGLYDFPRQALPSDAPPQARYFPELDTVRIARGDWIADITAYDAAAKRGAHVSGGTLSLLWNRRCGAVVAAGPAEDLMFEPNNQQRPQGNVLPGLSCPRIEAEIGGKQYAQQFDLGAVLRYEERGGATVVRADAHLCDNENFRAPVCGNCSLTYTLREDGLLIEGAVDPAIAGSARYILPVASDAARVSVLRGELKQPPTRIFSLTPGFLCREYTVLFDPDGELSIELTV
ncbi:MAG: hypothetical protein IJL26_11810 [Clostridia bacterium]|nr:hypothetical protein [Clostridia bacterium]